MSFGAVTNANAAPFEKNCCRDGEFSTFHANSVSIADADNLPRRESLPECWAVRAHTTGNEASTVVDRIDDT